MTELTQDLNTTLQELLTEPAPTLPNQILLFTSKVEPKNFVLKFNDHKYLGVPRIDCRNQTYWKFHELTDNLAKTNNH